MIETNLTLSLVLISFLLKTDMISSLSLFFLKNAAIISYKAFPLRKEVKKQLHLMLHTGALILGSIGIYAVFKFHNEKGIAHLYSLHSWIGLGAACFYAIQVTSNQLITKIIIKKLIGIAVVGR